MGNKLGVFLAGGLVGAVAALLCAPRTGSETRNMVAEKANAVWGEAQELGAQTASTAQQVVEEVAGPEAATRTQSFAQDAVAKGQNVVSAVASKGQEIYGAAASRVQEAKSGVKLLPMAPMTSARRSRPPVPASPRKSPRTPRSLRLRPPKRFRSRSLRTRCRLRVPPKANRRNEQQDDVLAPRAHVKGAQCSCAVSTAYSAPL